jgi:DNA-directed RNA polymerase subunit K/omega
MAVPSPSIMTRDVTELAKQTGNVYEAVVVIALRARQLSTKVKEELTNKLSDFASTVDNLEEIFENREQIEISKFYERLPKPTNIALEEFTEKKISFQRSRNLEASGADADDGVLLD